MLAQSASVGIQGSLNTVEIGASHSLLLPWGYSGPKQQGSSQIDLQDIVYELDTWRCKARSFLGIIPFDNRLLRQLEADDHY